MGACESPSLIMGTVPYQIRNHQSNIIMVSNPATAPLTNNKNVVCQRRDTCADSPMCLLRRDPHRLWPPQSARVSELNLITTRFSLHRIQCPDISSCCALNSGI